MTNKDLNNIIERATTEIRNEAIDPSAVAGAADRVWKRLSERAEDTSAAQVDHIRNCADFQALIPAYLGGTLSSARSLLLEDHTHECVPCRRALKEARHGVSASKRILEANLSKPSSSRSTVVRWAVAAAVVISILSGIAYQRLTRVTDAFHSMVYAMEGPVYLVSPSDTKPLTVGDELAAGQTIRTAKDAGAVVKLPDGSLIEMRERSEFSVTNNSDGTTIHLNRGNIIVEAAKQGQKHLFVQTGDSTVSVKGTIFSVNAGTKGSRVSVVEGEVHVDHNRKTDVLRAGDQVTTSANLDRVPVKDEIAWSRDAERLGKVLAEAETLRKDVDSRVEMPGVRYSTRLLDLVPSDAVFYVAIPNLSATLAESNKIIQERLNQNADLREWWEKDRGSAGGQQLFDRAIGKISEFGEQLGDEIVVTAQLGPKHEPGDPLVLTTLKDPAGFQNFVNAQLAQLGNGKQPSIKFIADPAAASAMITADAAGAETSKGKKGSKNNSDLYVWINGDVLAASPELPVLAQAADRARVSAGGRSEFLSKIADVYQEGAGFIIAADLEKIIAGSAAENSKSAVAMNRLGIRSLKHFIVEMKEDQGKSFNRAVLTFNDQRRGIASWLAAPGPMGALRYISPDATIVAAFVVSDPVALVDDLFGALNSVDPHFSDEIGRFNAETGLDIRRDFAAPLGGEFAFAIDGPVLPTPSWKLVFEVNDPAHLQQTFERVVEKVNEVAHRDGKQGLAWDRSESGGLTYYTLKSLDFGPEIDYVYVNGYLVAAPSRALIDHAVSYQVNQSSLLQSPRFIAALPDDKQANFSALVYQNLQPVFGPIARGMAGTTDALPAEGQQALKQLSGSVPVLAYAYAQGDRITFALNGEDGPIGLKPSNLIGMPGSFGLQNIIKQSMR
jgi:FecR-like protein/putative zinc finger protein